MAQADNNQQGNRVSINTYCNAQDYDNEFSSLSATIMTDLLTLRIAPIFDDMVGVKPKAGDKVYDYKTPFYFGLTLDFAYAIRNGIDIFLNQNEGGEVTRFSYTNNNRSVTIYAPNSVGIRGKRHDNYLIKFEKTNNKDGNREVIYHLLQNLTHSLVVSGEQVEYRVEHGLKLLESFCEEAITLHIGTYQHGGKFGGNGGHSSGSSRSSRFNREEIVEEDGSDSTNDGEKSNNRVPTNIDTEFDEDVV